MTDFKVLNKQKGFTLVELLVVVVILGLVSSAAMSLFGSANDRSQNAVRDYDIRSIVSASRFKKADTGFYPTDSIDFYHNANTYISIVPSDPKSSHDILLLGVPLSSVDTHEYSYSFWKPPQDYSEERILASTYFVNADDKNIYSGRYFVGTMTGPTSSIDWTTGTSYSVSQTNGGTILLNSL